MKFELSNAGFNEAHKTANRIAQSDGQHYVVVALAEEPLQYSIVLSSEFGPETAVAKGTVPMFVSPLVQPLLPSLLPSVRRETIP